MAHPSLIGEKELIDSLSIGSHPLGEGGYRSGQISNKTMAIALQYQDILQKMNNKAVTGIVKELRSLESETERLEHYISLLNEKRANVIRLYYFEGRTWDQLVKIMQLTKTTLINYRNEALTELESMYSFLDNVKGKQLGTNK